MSVTREHIYIAALLHDIGKFYQRGDENGATKSKVLDQDIKNLETMLCPKHKIYEYRTHKHVLWTAQFFKNYSAHFGNLINKSGSKISADELMNLSAAHHFLANNNLEQLIIQKADHYSSGIDRSTSDSAWKDAEEEQDNNWDAFTRIKMRSIFESIRTTETMETWQAEYTCKLPLNAINFDKTYFPECDTDIKADYKTLWSQFENELKFLQTDSFRSFSETLLNLLEKYCSRIPSSTQHLPDVSLYDHLKTTAAFAITLSEFINDKALKQIPSKSEKPFALIGGNLSGIQKFIYGIIARKAAKNLKGRSFYLQLLIDNIVQLLIEKLGLFDANVIYSSGGGFYILGANTTELEKLIADFEKSITKQFFEFHGTDLTLNIDFVAFGEEEIYYTPNSKNIGDVWKELAEKISLKKNKKFGAVIKENYNQFFEPSGAGGDAKRDAITGEEIIGAGTDVDGYTMNSYTALQIETGTKLNSADYWIIANDELTYLKEKSLNPVGLGKHNYLLTEIEIKEKQEQLRGSADKVRAMRINNLNFLEPVQKGIDNIYGFNLYGGNKFPLSKFTQKDNDIIKVFEELCGVEFSDIKRESRKSSPGLVRLGVLRMDVDNLGSIFKSGLSADKRSFSRYSTLSRSLDYFFKGYLNKIWSEDVTYSSYTQIIYSGGDDLFIVGKWDLIIKLARQINQEFRKWTCHNPALTLSGGAAFVGAKFPLLKAAEISATEEKKAKNHKYREVEKNAFCIFGFAFDWDNELPFLLNLKNEILDLIKDGLSEGFSSTIYNLMEQADFCYNNNEEYYELKNYEVIWLSAYNFKRAMQRTKSESVKIFFDTWANKIFIGKSSEVPGSRYHALQYLAIAARWATLEKR